jgi:hypothetical protein
MSLLSQSVVAVVVELMLDLAVEEVESKFTQTFH